ncbi:MAG: glycosyltransferase family 1 protein [Bacteroidales bacterium]|nr:glycosyltransferase family 1 protein [Bacteroidales bacterium]
MNTLHCDRYLHVVAFDIPWPANYGGAIDIYYKLKYLHKAGIKVILHVFQYGNRYPSPEIERLCYKTYYYPRDGWLSLFSKKPYIVYSRNDKTLLGHLLQDNYPILYEGIHTTFFISHPSLHDRKQFIRMHNVEHEYYKSLSRTEKKLPYKIYLCLESVKLKNYEKKILPYANGILAISPKDVIHYQQYHSQVFHISAFHPFDDVVVSDEAEPFALYHGSLDVSENSYAAEYLIKEVFSSLSVPFYIAGNKPPHRLVKLAQKYPHIKLLQNLTQTEFENLISKAQINILPTFQATGIKLKLLYALYRGKHVIVNSNMVRGTHLEELCYVADNPEMMKKIIQDLFNKPFSSHEILRRKAILEKNGFCNSTKIKNMIDIIFG